MIHGALIMNALPSLIIAPHSAVGGVAAKPKNDKPAISKITKIKSLSAYAIVSDETFGYTCLRMMRRLG